jgi:hypothetical protein
MNIKSLLKFKISFRKILRIYYFFIILATLTAFTYVTIFINKNIYQTIIQTDLVLPDSQTGNLAGDINIKKFNDLITSIENKTKPREIKYYKNIF